jgi:anti-anti-sigma factor
MTDDGLSFERSRDVLVACLSGEVDISNAETMERRIAEAAPPEEVGGVVVDLSGVSFLDSAGVRLLFALHATLTEQGRPMALVVPARSPVGRVLEIVDIQRVVWVARTVDEAFAHFEDPQDPLPRPA